MSDEWIAPDDEPVKPRSRKPSTPRAGSARKAASRPKVVPKPEVAAPKPKAAAPRPKAVPKPEVAAAKAEVAETKPPAPKPRVAAKPKPAAPTPKPAAPKPRVAAKPEVAAPKPKPAAPKPRPAAAKPRPAAAGTQTPRARVAASAPGDVPEPVALGPEVVARRAAAASYASLLPERSDPVWQVVGPPTGAVPARPVPADERKQPVAAPSGAFPWVPVSLGVALALVVVGLVLLSSSSPGLPGAPGFPLWAVVVVVLVAGGGVAAGRAVRRRPTDGQAAGTGWWRRLADTRVIGSIIAVALLLAALTMSRTPGYSADIREIPGEVNGLIQQAVAQPEKGFPRIEIKRVGIDLLLVKGDGGTPPVKYEAFTYPHADHLLDQQGIPGNTYVYAHARTGMFWNLHDLNIGDKVVIDYGGGKTIVYTVTEIHRSVNWKDFRWLQPTADDRLTLQTCNGWKDDDPRFIVVARRQTGGSTALAR